MEIETIKRLSRLFTADDIMTRAEYLKKADDIENANNLFNVYDVVPSPKKGNIKGYFYLKDKKFYELRMDLIVSQNTSILKLSNILSQKNFCFVIADCVIIGYIHYSDLNKAVTKIPLFGIFQTAERKLWDRINNKINEIDLLKIFDTNAVQNFIKKKEYNRRRNIDIDWNGIFTFPYILKLARFYGATDLTDPEIKLLKETRNKLAHSDRNLVNSLKEVQKLSDAIDLCQSITQN